MILETGNLKLGVERHPPIQYQVSSIKFQTLNLTTCPEYALLISPTTKSGIAPVSGFFYWPNKGFPGDSPYRESGGAPFGA